MHIGRTATLFMTALLAASCGNQQASEGEETASADAPAEDSGWRDPRKDFIEACQIRMIAPDAKTFTTYWDPRGKRAMGEGPSWANSPYWANAEEREKLAASKAETLSFSCTAEDDDGQMQFGALFISTNMTEQDLPFGPGTYPILPPRSGDQAKGFRIWPLMYGQQSMFEPQGGSLEIKRFDDQGIAGSFTLQAKEQVTGDRTLAVSGTFDIPCRGGILESACKANKRIDD